MDFNPDTARASIRNIILSIRPLENGFDDLPYDAPLFKDGSGEPSPVNLDSLDILDLAMLIGNEFGLDNTRFDRLIESDDGLQRLRTVNHISDLVLSLANGAGAGTGPVAAILQRKEVEA